jgi:hypothetical protein
MVLAGQENCITSGGYELRAVDNSFDKDTLSRVSGSTSITLLCGI